MDPDEDRLSAGIVLVAFAALFDAGIQHTTVHTKEESQNALVTSTCKGTCGGADCTTLVAKILSNRISSKVNHLAMVLAVRRIHVSLAAVRL